MKLFFKAKKWNPISFLLVFVGISLVAGVAVFEAFRFPWASVFGGTQEETALPDPPAIVWENGDGEASSSSSPASSKTAASSGPASSSPVLPGNETARNEKPARYVELGLIKIPKLNLSQHLLEGAQGQLHYGVGHVTGTAPVGGKGNCALAGHNTTSFRYLSKLSEGDKVFVISGGTTYAYSVYQSFTVLPTDLDVLKDVDGENAVLTLITCTPYLTGTHRLIVRARLTAVNGNAPSSAPKPGYEPNDGITDSSPAKPSSSPNSSSSDSRANG